MLRTVALSLGACLLAVAAQAAQWVTSLDEAVRLARDQKKAIIAHVPTGASDDLLRAAEAEPATARALEAFVLLRVDRLPRGDRGVLLLDPNGDVVVSIDIKKGMNGLASSLVSARDAEETIVRSAESRRSGKTAVADYLLGRSLMTMALYARAEKVLMKTVNSARYEGESDIANLAQATAGMAMYLRSKSGHDGGWRNVNAVIRNSRTPAVLAQARFFRGTMEAIEGRQSKAALEWRKAWELAPPGSDLAAEIRAALESVDQKALQSTADATAGASLRIIAPPKKTIIGKAQFEAIATGKPASITFYLDDVPVATLKEAPYRAAINFGSTPSPRVLKVVSFSDSGAALAETSITVNDRTDAFRVAIISPTGPLASGVVDIEAEATVPSGRTLSRLEVFWNGNRLATWTAPPFRTRAEIPGGFGYVRALATLDDGSTTEAVRILNTEGASTSVDVQGVTFAAVVSDPHGERVAGLHRQDFTVEEEGVAVPFSIREDIDEPVTIGLAIDISSSMRQSLLLTFRYAEAFIGTGEKSSDRTFVVAFDATPRLVQTTTTDANLLRNAVFGLRPAGGTSLYDGIAFGLQQFDGVSGKRALVVITDGKDVRSSTDAAACARVAQQMGVPIYIVSMNTRVFGNTLIGLAEQTGGMFIPAPRLENMSAIFRKVRDEVRGQYLITFVSPKPAAAGTWRDLKVKTTRGKVKTVAGYRVP